MQAAALTHFLNVFDVVFEDEKVRFALASQANERLVVIFDGAGDLLAVLHLHSHDGAVLNQLFEVSRLLKRLFRRARISKLVVEYSLLLSSRRGSHRDRGA